MSKAWKGPQLWLSIWGALGALFLLYVIVASSGSPERARGPAPSPVALDRSLLVGEMADFEYAFPPRGAPSVAFERDGATLTIADFRGKAVLVNFWATWCAPCLKELPSLNALQRELGGEDFEVVAIASDPRGPATAQAFLDRLEIEALTLYADPKLSLITTMGGQNVLPLSVLYDRQGQEIGRLVGDADWSSEEAKTLMRAAMSR